LFSTGARSACKETVHRWERETGLEPATACLEGRRLRSRRSPGLHRPHSRFYKMYMQCERAWQKMSRAFFRAFGKRCHVFLPMILAKDVANISRQEVTLLSKLYLLSIVIGNAS
jgi:hypothetical protein